MLPFTLQNKLLIVTLLGILIVSPLVLSWYLMKWSSHEPLPPGMRIPSLVVSTLNGTKFLLNYQGKKHILIFFSTECARCRNALSDLDGVYVQFKSRMEFIALSLSTLERTKQLFEMKKYSFPLFQWCRSVIKDSLNVTEVPAVVFVDEQRIVRHGYTGDKQIGEVRTLLQKFAGGSFSRKE
jgi:peroxiredoxin